MCNITPEYYLYEETQLFGDELKRKEYIKDKKFHRFTLLRTNKMAEILELIHLMDDRNKTYVVQKYVNGHLQWRDMSVLQRIYGEDSYCKSYDNEGRIRTSSTLEKYCFHEESGKWKATNFRYKDEIVTN